MHVTPQRVVIELLKDDAYKNLIATANKRLQREPSIPTDSEFPHDELVFTDFIITDQQDIYHIIEEHQTNQFGHRKFHVRCVTARAVLALRFL